MSRLIQFISSRTVRLAIALSWYSFNSSTVLLITQATSATNARIYSRDAKEIAEFAKGYPYITNMSSTKGHIAKLTAALWHPKKKDQIITASHDSTVRFWNAETVRVGHKQIIKLKSTVCVLLDIPLRAQFRMALSGLLSWLAQSQVTVN